MITVEQATERVLATAKPLSPEFVSLEQARGRVLAEDLTADRDFPPFHRVTMDGIAIAFSAFQAGNRTFRIAGIQAAGEPQLSLDNSLDCLEVMTGAVLPQNTDTVIRYEDLDIRDGVAQLQIEQIQAGQNVHRQGHDRKTGDLIIPHPRMLSPAEIGVAATIGKSLVRVLRQPKVVIIATGDELVPVDAQPLPHQIRISNAYQLAAALDSWQIHAERLHLRDDPQQTREQLAHCLSHYDAIILSGGVSMGKYDHVPTALDELGVQKSFHRVMQRPGKPFWFGVSTDGKPVFAFPGNPVSSFVGITRYFLPWLKQSLGLQPFSQHAAILGKDFSFTPHLTYFLQVRIHFNDKGQLIGMPFEGHGSGDLANLADADAFMQLPAEQTDFKQGEVFPVFFYRMHL
ncbi:MAG: molybdopterin molybdotransferase MoeA [Saprospiraceae bacterium]|jgi:molybdopterin molybdotransferase|nr:molybdopterin molybdotransferase MoeA [Saprospiraceae bacterium]MDP4999863.1 molybdopterin molybdotransferase MoeA [Saprospiraceae bacterium]